ncbi:uncharacterized protein LOC129596876 [Paramacrobiotus metropolitanus]|uniref:uncharacterized protein LOC129596876 n=1 Tax=Paramacrobiotus metropolitanus TaxID=2943436 RepID=UPI002445B8C0|nr:uncharacterized protein LOC129596876 [Paramacrobiotus metropolitanus]
MWDADAGRFDVTIPWLRFCCTETAAEKCQRFLAALNDSCPPVTQRVLNKVTAMHARWRQTLDTPYQRAGILGFLQMFNGVRGDGIPQCWDQIDLRQLDCTVLNKLTFAALDAYYKN